MHAIPLENILFLDIETVSQKSNFEELSSSVKDLWTKKADYMLRSTPELSIEESYGRAAIYAEFGKIVCISLGIISTKTGSPVLKIKSISSHNEKELLIEFFDLLNSYYHTLQHYLCAHNGKEFDFPYICRRALIHQIELPLILKIQGKKPWEVRLLDTMHMWKFGDYKSYTSLNLLAYVFNIPTPKDDIDGSMVGEVYWKGNNLERITEYCQKDVITLTNVYLRLVGRAAIEDVVYV